MVSEAYRIRLAHLSDPYLAIHTSRIEPLPHQITAVYGEMLPRQDSTYEYSLEPPDGAALIAGAQAADLHEMIRRCR
jgi:hypothetical protein